MNTLAALLWKDLRRAWRNPAGWVAFLAIPLVITGLIGIIFGPKSESDILGRIRVAIVDEDDSPVTRFLRGTLNQPEAGKHLDPVFLTRAEAQRQLEEGKISAAVVIPAGFGRNYLASTNIVAIELIKNPAQSVHPAVIEECLTVMTTGLDIIKRHLAPELVAIRPILDSGDYQQVAAMIVRVGDKVEAARKLLFPPLVTYGPPLPPPNFDTPKSPAIKPTPSPPSRTAFNIFGYLLPGMAGLFLLFLAEYASHDIHREVQLRTLERFRGLRQDLYAFVASKVVFCLVFLLLSGAIMLVGGGFIFRIRWEQPLTIFGLTVAYCMFASGLMTLLPALMRDERVAQALGNVVAMAIGFLGGSMFPAQQMPPLLRDHVAPFLPNYWYTEALRSISFDHATTSWLVPLAKLSVLGVVCIVLAAVALRRNLERAA